MVSARFQDKLGTVMASIGTVSGLGCMVGPVLGGVRVSGYRLGALTLTLTRTLTPTLTLTLTLTRTRTRTRTLNL